MRALRPCAGLLAALALNTSALAGEAPGTPIDPAPATAAAVWSAIPPPSGRTGATMVVDTRRHRALIFGGSYEFLLNAEVWSAKLQDGFGWTRIEIPGVGPAPRLGAAAVYDETGDRLLMYGGRNDQGGFEELWELPLGSPPRWNLLAVGGPPARAFASLVIDTQRRRLLLYGGLSDAVEDLADLWECPIDGPPIWSRLATPGPGPGPRSRHSAIYDPVQDRVVLFGGSVEFEPRGDAWSLKLADGPSWSAMNHSGLSPSPRYGQVAVYDAAQQRMVMYGGYDLSYQSDTWALALGADAWTPLAFFASPPGRTDHIAAYDAASHRMMMFGGFNGFGDYPNDVWFLDLAAQGIWTRAQAHGIPRSRRYHNAIYDGAQDRMLIFGGDVGGGFRIAPDGDAWALPLVEGAPWTELAPTSGFPQGRAGAALVLDTRRHRLVGFGGNSGVTSSGPYLNDAFTLDLDPPAWSALHPLHPLPNPRAYTSAIYDSLRDRMLVFGGIVNRFPLPTAPVAELWELSLAGATTWTQLVPTGSPTPSARLNPIFVMDAAHDRAILLGGTTGAGNPFLDLWQLSLAPPMTWTRLNPDNNPPARRARMAATWDAPKQRLIVFGGADSLGPHADVWALSLVDKPHWSVIATAGGPVPGRFASSVILDPQRGRALIFGGESTGGLRNDVWALNFGADPTTDVRDTHTSGGVAFTARAFPNPARAGLTVEFALPRAAEAVVDVFDLEGRVIAHVANGTFAAGTHAVRWDRAGSEGRRIRPGIYYLSIAVAGERLARRIVLLD